MLLLDTHVLIWLDEGNPRLGNAALRAIDEALTAGELGVATISFWEVAMLIDKKRLRLQAAPADWRSELLQAGLQEIPLRGATAIRAGQLPLFHGDPADRLIVATAIENAATLVTADEKILAWRQLPQTIDARL